eukprot:TRINITY_DN19173_c0_g1_i1.p1 TRINITY_DN19173_c0_g1~~TRINITY_DN19173_c0_g1_i1.p1  ORF type:complete len:351 (+),score=78.63 TRINITY_DN19173_c0_g1_i1:85-1137(+)
MPSPPRRKAVEALPAQPVPRNPTAWAHGQEEEDTSGARNLPATSQLNGKKVPAAGSKQPLLEKPPGAGTGGECFHVRQVKIDALLDDGTLGLLLHGTSIIGFCSEAASHFGWLVGDQIVEVNGQSISAFEEFLEKFMAAQAQGFPIHFGVLRREVTAKDEFNDPLEGFFSQTNFVDLADQLRSKFGSTPRGKHSLAAAINSQARNGCEDQEDNPYIQALRQRRSELCRNTEDWMDETGCQSLAARMATEREGSLATLSRASTDTPRDLDTEELGPKHVKDLGFFCSSAVRPCQASEAAGYEVMMPPPPMKSEWEVEQLPSWPGFQSPAKSPAVAALAFDGAEQQTSDRGL